MREITVSPGTLQAALDAARPGDVVVLAPGRYHSPFRIAGVRGHATAPLIVEAREPGAIVTQGRPADSFRTEANGIARELEERGKYPGLYEAIDQAQLSVTGSSHVVLRNLEFEEGWPTHVYLGSSKDVTIRDCRFRDATFCIAALGRSTKRILVEGCSWVQDRVPGRIWSQTPWYRVHGTMLNPGYPPVDIANDWRQFDGDFFRSDGIAGGVTIRHCIVADAFNAIHGFNDNRRGDLNRDFHVHDCTFLRIRDNVFEPEKHGENWWFHHNRIVDCHKPYSLTTRSNHFCLIFANLVHFASIQSDTDDPRWPSHRSGGVFKAPTKQTMPSGPTYVFHNSVITRSDYLRKGFIPGLVHANNAVLHATDRALGQPRKPWIFGNPADPEPDERFTTDWAQHRISIDGDVQDHPDWPDGARARGYRVGAGSLGADPQFLGWDRANERVVDEAALFHLGPRSRCRGRGIALTLPLPWLDEGEGWNSPAGADVGAWQHNGSGAPRLFEGPAYRAVEWGLPATVIPPVQA